MGLPRPTVVRVIALALAAAVAQAGAARAQRPAGERNPAKRVVSLNPSLTATLIAIGAGAQLVGVDDYSARQQSSVRNLPSVGGLFNPSLEAIVGLEPDLVVLVPSAQQRDLRGRLEALDIAVLELPNITLEELLASIEALGARVGRESEARLRVREIRSAWQAAGARNEGFARVRSVLVLQRDPLYVVGRGSFIDSMLEAGGAENLANVFAEPYPRASLEWLIAAAPDLILDASEDPEEPHAYWARWPSLPAVAAGRVHRIPASEVTLPGPFPERALARLSGAIRQPAARRLP